jgi:hypothetical protein
MIKNFHLEFLSETDFGKKLGVEGRTIRWWGEEGFIVRCYNNHPDAGYDWNQPKWLYLWNDSVHIWYEQFKKERGWTDVQKTDYSKIRWYDYDFYLAFGRALVKRFDTVQHEEERRKLEVIEVVKNFSLDPPTDLSE